MILPLMKLRAVDVGAFLGGLLDAAPRSTGEKALAAHVIKRHAEEIEGFLAQQERANQYPLVAQYRKAIARYAPDPRQVHFDAPTSHLRYRDFRLVASQHHSLTFPTRHRTARVVGYLLAILLGGLILWGGLRLGRTAIALVETRTVTPGSDE